MLFPHPQAGIEVEPAVSGDEDSWGSSAEGWGDRIVLHQAVAVPRDSSESNAPGRENRVITGKTLLWFDDVTILPADRVWVGGECYEVEGEAGDYRNDPFSGPWAGQQVALKKVAG